MSATDHNLPEEDSKAGSTIGVVRGAEILFEDLERTSVGLPEEFEIRIKLSKAIHNRGSSNGPVVSRLESTTGETRVSLVVLFLMSALAFAFHLSLPK